MTLSYRRERLVRIKKKNEERLGELASKGRVKALFGSEVTEILEDRVRLRLGERSVELPNDYVFVFAGGEPPFELLRGMGVRFGGERAERAGRPIVLSVRKHQSADLVRRPLAAVGDFRAGFRLTPRPADQATHFASRKVRRCLRPVRERRSAAALLSRPRNQTSRPSRLQRF